MYYLMSVFFVAWGIYIYHVITDKRLIGFYWKGLTSFAFLLAFGYGMYNFLMLSSGLIVLVPRDIAVCILCFIGLIAGLVGDLFLEMMHVDKTKDKMTIITYGMIIFLIGHLFYIAGLIQVAQFSYISLIIGSAMTGIVYLGSKMMKLDMGRVTILSYVYSFVIFTMIGQAIMNGFYFEFNTFSLLFMIGAILFGISDLFLAPLYFGGENRKSIVVLNLSTYYFGQLLIALSVYYLLPALL